MTSNPPLIKEFMTKVGGSQLTDGLLAGHRNRYSLLKIAPSYFTIILFRHFNRSDPAGCYHLARYTDKPITESGVFLTPCPKVALITHDYGQTVSEC